MATTPPTSSDTGDSLFDSAHPFRGVVVCCTSIPPEQRAAIAEKTEELGGIHKYDLTPDVTHLIVGEYDTPKYRHVAKERQDIRPMAAGWVDAVRDLWMADAEIHFDELEKEWKLKTFETDGGRPTAQTTQLQPQAEGEGASTGDPSKAAEEPTAAAPVERGRLLICITGFDDAEERARISRLVTTNGGGYTGDLTKRVTHLISARPEGRKFNAARDWGIHTVTIEWLRDSVERGLILEERCYDPLLPTEDIGKGAWNRKSGRVSVSLGKRLRDAAAAAAGGDGDSGRRKLRKTASMKLNSQRESMWGDILGKKASVESFAPMSVDDGPSARGGPVANTAQPVDVSARSFETQGSKLASFSASDEGHLFASSCFYIHGFSAKQTAVLADTVSLLGGLVSPTLDDVTSNSGAQMQYRFLIVPQSSRGDSHPEIPDHVYKVTEFYLEKCLYKKHFFHPNEHVVGRPFSSFPISGFENLSICTAGFTGVDLNQIDKSIRQLGAQYVETFTAQTSLLLCASLQSVRKQKLELALRWKVPVLNVNWLWESISSGEKEPIERFFFPELRQAVPLQSKEVPRKTKKAATEVKPRRASLERSARPGIKAVDMPAFAKEGLPAETIGAVAPPAVPAKEDSTTTLDYDTAPTHQELSKENSGAGDTSGNTTSRALSETSANSLNKSPTRPTKVPIHQPLNRQPSEIQDSAPLDDESDGGQDNRATPVPTRAEAASSAALTRRLEKEKAARATADRLQLSEKVNTLVDGFTAAAGAGDEVASARPTRRKRAIMGRAVSNVSAASSGSVDSASGAGTGGKTGSAAASFAAALQGGGLSRGGGGGAGAGDTSDVFAEDSIGSRAEDKPPPPSTQIEYEDPEAKEFKAQMVRKILGQSEGVSPAANTRSAAKKLTMGDLAGFAVEGEPGAAGAGAGGRAAGGGGAAGRTRRRGF